MSLLAKLKPHKENRGFAPIGVMECWSSGVLVSKMKNLSLFIEIHHSNTPYAWHEIEFT
jgi:hypothetical protein